MKNSSKLGTRIGLIVGIILLCILILWGVFAYFNQTQIYNAQFEQNIRNLGEYLALRINEDGDDFIRYQNYYLEHYAEIDVPVDVDEYVTAERAYHEAFAQHHPGKTLDVDITFDELDPEVKNAYMMYKTIYWGLVFWQAREPFGVLYTYYIVPNSDTHFVTYMIDVEPMSRADMNAMLEEYPEDREFYNYHYQGDEEEFMYLCIEVFNAYEGHEQTWLTWETDEEQVGFQVWDNEFGHTYSYNTPVYVNGEKIGLIGTEVEVERVNHAVLNNTLRQMAAIGLIMLGGWIAMVMFINRRYVRQIVKLENSVKEYTETKDVAVAEEIKKNIRGDDEIASLGNGIESMILELQDYMQNLAQTSQKLDQATLTAAQMTDLANKDSLTGIRNMTAYKYEVKKLDEQIQNGDVEFAIAMIDLNKLKETNDTFGHDAGNDAIKKLSEITCQVFKHSMVFRIGGDEFAVILRNEDYQNRTALLAKFQYRLESLQHDSTLKDWEKINAAIGMAVYTPESDKNVDSVFKRADALMYETKREMESAD